MISDFTCHLAEQIFIEILMSVKFFQRFDWNGKGTSYPEPTT